MTYSFAYRSILISKALAAVVLFGLGAPGSSLAETMDCTPITSLPKIITVQGIYCLTGNLSTTMTTGHAIEIQTNNVTIDLNGWKLGGLNAGTATQTNGIYAYDRKNITIRNGTVRGFYRGVYLDGANAQGNLIEDIRAEQNRFAGIDTHGRGDIIRRNQVVDTGGSSYTFAAVGVYVTGDGARVIDNDIVGVIGSGGVPAKGIDQRTGTGAVIEYNRIAEVANPDAGFSLGINMYDSSNTLVSGNRITGPIDYGVLFGVSTSGAYRDNTVFDATIGAYSGGTDYNGNEP